MIDARPTATTRSPGAPGPAGPDSMTARLYADVRGRPYGAILTHDEGLRITGAVTIVQFQQVARRVNRKLWNPEDQRALQAIANVGYRIVAPNEHVKLAGARERASARKLKGAFKILDAAKRDALTAPEREVLDTAQRRVGRQLAFRTLVRTHGDALPEAPRIRRLMPGDFPPARPQRGGEPNAS